VPGKATKAEVMARVEAVFELRLGGAGFADIRQYASAPTDREGKQLEPWDVSDRQLWRYIDAADKLCQERYDAHAPHLLARHLLRRERLYAHALEVGDYRTALAVLKDEAELEGLYNRRLELTGKDGGAIQFIEVGSADAPPDRASEAP
jgi:hypothetical protein